MIALDSIKKLNTVVVYVTNDLEPGSEMGLLLGADLVGCSQFIDAPQLGNSPAGVVALTSMRNQLTVTIRPDKLEFNDGSDEVPARLDFPNRVALTAQHIARQSNQSYSAVGLNFHIEAASADGELPSRVVVNRLMRRERLENTGYNAIGATARFWYMGANNTRYELRIEPRGGQHEDQDYFASLNVHVPLQGKIAPVDWLTYALNAEYTEFMRILMEILEER